MEQIIGNNLHLLREKFHYTQDEVANYLTIDRGAYANFECGNREMPYELMLKTCEFYGLSLSDLMEEDAAKLEEELICCFRTDHLGADDIKEIARFKNIVRNYLKILVK
jgi:transcriptional regulator with XRE-family HTH domain